MAAMIEEYLEFVKFDEIFLEKSWNWITTEPIKTLIDAGEINKEDQLNWYGELENRTDYFVEGIKYKSTPIGVWGLKKITSDNAEYYGYIGEPEFWGKGIGKIIIARAINKAKKVGIKTLYLHVLKFNQRAINLYKRFGFCEDFEKSDEKMFFMELNI